MEGNEGGQMGGAGVQCKVRKNSGTHENSREKKKEKKDWSLHGRPTKKKSDKTDAMLTAYSNNTPNDNKTTFMYVAGSGGGEVEPERERTTVKTRRMATGPINDVKLASAQRLLPRQRRHT
jgi:hypothetical protein